MVCNTTVVWFMSKNLNYLRLDQKQIEALLFFYRLSNDSGRDPRQINEVQCNVLLHWFTWSENMQYGRLVRLGKAYSVRCLIIRIATFCPLYLEMVF